MKRIAFVSVELSENDDIHVPVLVWTQEFSLAFRFHGSEDVSLVIRPLGAIIEQPQSGCPRGAGETETVTCLT